MKVGRGVRVGAGVAVGVGVFVGICVSVGVVVGADVGDAWGVGKSVAVGGIGGSSLLASEHDVVISEATTRAIIRGGSIRTTCV